MPSDNAPVSVLGLGMMGSALAAALIRAGHPTTVWNRTAAKTGPLVAQGATPAATAAEAITAAPLVIVCLTTNDGVRALLTPETDALAGRTVVNLTNGTPAQARELADWAAAHGITYIDGGIMAVPQMIATPAAYILYSGTDEDAFATHRPTLAALADTKWVGKDPGLAALYDLSLLTGMYGMVMGVVQAYALIGSAGVPADRVRAAAQGLGRRHDERCGPRCGRGTGLRAAPHGRLVPRDQPGRAAQLPYRVRPVASATSCSRRSRASWTARSPRATRRTDSRAWRPCSRRTDRPSRRALRLPAP